MVRAGAGCVAQAAVGVMARAGQYQRSSLREKQAYTKRTLAGLPQPLWRCRICSVQVTARDREGHLRRAHSANAVVERSFAMVKR